MVPEFFYLPYFLKNTNNYNFGITQSNVKVDDVILPECFNNNEYLFIYYHRKALESNFVSSEINQWIDLIFGCLQNGENAEKAFNVFQPYTYIENLIFLQNHNLLSKDIVAHISEFGQIPLQLFTTKHPKKIIENKERKKFYLESSFMRNKENVKVVINLLDQYIYISTPTHIFLLLH